MDLLQKAKELEKLNNEIFHYTSKNEIYDVFYNSSFIDEHIRDLIESIKDYNKINKELNQK